MTRALIKFVCFAIFPAVFFVTSATGQADDVANRLDPGLSIAVDLNERVRLDFSTGREKSQELESGKWKIGGGISFRVKPLFKRFLDAIDTDKKHVLVLGAAYEYSRDSDSNVTASEHKLMFDATFRWAFKQKFLLSNRNRAEFLSVNGNYHFRLRERLLLERPVRIPIKGLRREITPFGAAEAFWDNRYREWNLFRFGVGVQIPLFRRLSADLSYQRERCVTCPDPNTNVLAVTLNVYFRRKKK